MEDYDDVPVQRPRWIGWVIIIGMILVVLGLLNLGVRLYIGTASDQAAAKVVGDVAQQRRSWCRARPGLMAVTACAAMVWIASLSAPGFMQVAERYREQPEGQAYLARKIREGSVGVWGNVIMPRHPQVTQEQSEGMAAWILALPSPKAE